MARLKITLKKSTIGCLRKQIDTVRALGLRKLHQSVIQEDNAIIRGMIFRVAHLVDVAEIQAEEA